jgi:hypothetical protein
MRQYIDTCGRFKIDIPDHWNCREEDQGISNPVTFMFGDNSEDCFQINCISKNKGLIPDILERNNFTENKYLESSMSFLKRNINMDDMEMTIFEAKVEDHFILAIHTSSKKEVESETIKKHLHQINQSLETLLVIHPSTWEYSAVHARFNRFMVSLLASIDLTNKAQENGSSIELVILYANRIDALLRLALILKKQLQDSTDDIDIKFIFQGEEDKPIFEKAIYEQALADGVIEEPLFKRLMNLYELRNKVVHRYIISDLKTNDIIKLVADYMDIHEIIGSKVGALEQEQFINGIGIYGDGNNPKDPIDTDRMKGLLTELHDKHANTQIIKEMTIKMEINDDI